MSASPPFILLVTVAVPALGLAACSSSSSSGGAGGEGGHGSSTATTGATSTATSSGTGESTSTSSGMGGSGGGGATTGSSSATSSTSSTSSSSTGGGGCSPGNVGLPPAPCALPPTSCNYNIAECLPLHDNAAAPTFGLRMAALSLTAPPSIANTFVKTIIEYGVTPSEPNCNLYGGGTASWLLAFDTIAGTVKTGGADPPADSALGYSFIDQDYPIIGGTLHVAPVVLDAPIDAACSTSSTAGDVTLPVYFGAMANTQFLLPLRQARFVNLTVSGNHDCIGKYNVTTLDPANGCVFDAAHPGFSPGAQLTAFIDLEQADTIPIAAIAQSLCVVLSGDAATYGDGGQPMNRCKRVNGKILFQGDWCTATNQPASAQCNDAVHLDGAFAASGVIIN